MRGFWFFYFDLPNMPGYEILGARGELKGWALSIIIIMIILIININK
jgi:hypothetical protein